MLYAIFFASGASALIFETLWFRQAGLAFGNSIWASSLVLSGFMGGLALGKPVLGVVFDSVFHLTEEGWRRLTLRWALFFFALAILNEIVWRTQSTDFWVNFKVFGVVPLTFLFAAMQYPLLQKYEEK